MAVEVHDLSDPHRVWGPERLAQARIVTMAGTTGLEPATFCVTGTIAGSSDAIWRLEAVIERSYVLGALLQPRNSVTSKGRTSSLIPESRLFRKQEEAAGAFALFDTPARSDGDPYATPGGGVHGFSVSWR